jgi:hypothetical protein
MATQRLGGVAEGVAVDRQAQGILVRKKVSTTQRRVQRRLWRRRPCQRVAVAWLRHDVDRQRHRGMSSLLLCSEKHACLGRFRARALSSSIASPMPAPSKLVQHDARRSRIVWPSMSPHAVATILVVVLERVGLLRLAIQVRTIVPFARSEPKTGLDCE